jgi:hypothetical protein
MYKAMIDRPKTYDGENKECTYNIGGESSPYKNEGMEDSIRWILGIWTVDFSISSTGIVSYFVISCYSCS